MSDEKAILAALHGINLYCSNHMCTADDCFLHNGERCFFNDIDGDPPEAWQVDEFAQQQQAALEVQSEGYFDQR